MQELFEYGIQQFINYEKKMLGKKTRTQKKQQKKKKLKQDLQNLNEKKKRNNKRHQIDKRKLLKQLQQLTQEQKKIYLKRKKQKHQEIKIKLISAIKTGQQIYIDLSYEELMNQKENKSLCIQIELIMKAIKKIQNPPGIHLYGVRNSIQVQLNKMGYIYWTLLANQNNLMEVQQSIKDKLIYLSPDAIDPLIEVSKDHIYVIGGLIDRTIKKNASLRRAKELGIQAKHLPIRKFMINRSCLNLDHVVKILCKFQETGNWKEAFQYGAPKRWKKIEDKKKLEFGQEEEKNEEGEKKQGQKEKQEQEEQQKNIKRQQQEQKQKKQSKIQEKINQEQQQKI